MIVILACVLLALTVKQSGGRAAIVAIFALPSFVFQAVSSQIPGSMFFVVAAFFDLAVIVALTKLYKYKLAVALAVASVVSVALNVVGWSLYHSYIAGIFYDLTFTAYYLAVISVILFLKDAENGHGDDRRRSSATFNHKHGGTARLDYL